MRLKTNQHHGLGRRRAVTVLVLSLVLAVGLFSVASALTAGNVDGVWGSPTPANTSDFRWCYAPDNPTGLGGAPTSCSTSNAGIQNPPGSTLQDENQFRYGSPTGFFGTNANRSGYGFNGTNNVGPIAADQPFFLGRFTHYNRPITANNSLTGISLNVTLTGLLCDDNSVPTEGGTQSFVYSFTHEETPNNPPGYPGSCPYGDSTGNGCDDRVTVSQQPDTVFTCPEGLRTVQILGFFTNANCHVSISGNPSTSFITGEDRDNSACLWARISDPETPFAVTLDSFEAQWVDESVQVTWHTTSELRNLGFNLYRSESPDELGELLTPQFIPSQAPGSPQGFFYAFEDSGVSPDVVYWYTLEDIDVSGFATQHGPVSAVPQIPTAVTLTGLAADATQTPWTLPLLVSAALLAALAGGVAWKRVQRSA